MVDFISLTKGQLQDFALVPWFEDCHDSAKPQHIRMIYFIWLRYWQQLHCVKPCWSLIFNIFIFSWKKTNCVTALYAYSCSIIDTSCVFTGPAWFFAHHEWKPRCRGRFNPRSPGPDRVCSPRRCSGIFGAWNVYRDFRTWKGVMKARKARNHLLALLPCILGSCCMLLVATQLLLRWLLKCQSNALTNHPLGCWPTHMVQHSGFRFYDGLTCCSWICVLGQLSQILLWKDWRGSE